MSRHPKDEHNDLYLVEDQEGNYRITIPFYWDEVSSPVISNTRMIAKRFALAKSVVMAELGG